MRWSFRTNGNYIDFVHTDETSLAVELVVISLHNTSRAVCWQIPTDTNRISFSIGELDFENILITDIDFDGVPMNSQDDFQTGVEGMFPNLASGVAPSADYLIYVPAFTQSGTSHPTVIEIANTTDATVTWTRVSEGSYRGTTTIPDSTNFSAIMIPGFSGWEGAGTTLLPISNGSAIQGYYTIYYSIIGGFYTIEINVYDNTFAAAEWSDVMGTSQAVFQVFFYQ